MKKILIIVIFLLIIGTGGYFVYQYLYGIPSLPIITPAAPVGGPVWVKNSMEQGYFNIRVLNVSLPDISVEYTNMPPSGVNVINNTTGDTIWRQTLTTTSGAFSGRTVITLPRGIANSSKYYGEYILEVFGHESFVYATSLPFNIGDKDNAQTEQGSVTEITKDDFSVTPARLSNVETSNTQNYEYDTQLHQTILDKFIACVKQNDLDCVCTYLIEESSLCKRMPDDNLLLKFKELSELYTTIFVEKNKQILGEVLTEDGRTGDIKYSLPLLPKYLNVYSNVDFKYTDSGWKVLDLDIIRN